MKKKIFKVKGMHCPSCEMLVVDSLQESVGVVNAEASHKAGTVSVEFDESKIADDDLRNVIRKEGYEVV